MRKLVVTCPATGIALLTDVTVETKFMEQVAHTFVSIYCRACEETHAMRVSECKSYPVRSHSRELQKAS
jgi:hypothetical protein